MLLRSIEPIANRAFYVKLRILFGFEFGTPEFEEEEEKVDCHFREKIEMVEKGVAGAR